MEEQQLSPVTQDLDNFFNIEFDTTTRKLLRQAAVWAKISALCAFIGYGISLIVAFIGRPEYSIETEGAKVSTVVTATSILGVFVSVAVGSFISYFLYRFAVSTIRGVDFMDNTGTNQGFSSLRTYFKILGICLIIALCVIVFALIVSLFSSFG